MTSFLISLDELERVKRANGLRSITDLSRATGISRNTWSAAVGGRKPTPSILDALARLGARPERVLISDEPLRASA